MNGKLYRTMEFIMNAFILNLLWLVICLPILTIFPATTALFAVVRQWQKEKDIKIFSAFFRHLKANFRQSFILGILWIFFTFLLIGDFIITNQMQSNLKYVLFAFFFLLSIVYLFASITIFPIIVHYRVSWKDAIKNAMLLSIGYPQFVFLSLCIIAGTVVIILYFPAASMIAFSVAAYLIYALVSKAFQKDKKVQTKFQTVAE
ncbi:YesL family protein [Neobacillus niacini]|uniref:YesL family protein n=1 Tax=Neobacillus niacini TaxID=86668 RepID=UPI0039838FD6